VSQKDVENDYWEADFKKIERIDVIQIQWKLPPKRFKIFFKIDLQSEWIPASDIFVKYTLKDTNGVMIKNNDVSEYNTAYFNKPILCKKLRITMNEPLNKKSFSIINVNFYSKSNTGIMKANKGKLNSSELCWFVNTDKPRPGSHLISYPCIDAISVGSGKELFDLEPNNFIKLHNTDLCVGYSEKNTDIILKDCKEEKPAYKIEYDQDGSMYFKGRESLRISIENNIKNSINLINKNTEIIATSELDNEQNKKENIFSEGKYSWTSAVGQKEVTLQLLFGKIKCNKCKYEDEYESFKIDTITIKWKIEPKDFSLFTWRPGYSWKNIKTYKNNKAMITELTIVNEFAAGIMIHITDGYNNPEYNNEVIYSIQSISISSDGYKMENSPKNTKDISLKFFDFEKQFLTKNSEMEKYGNTLKSLGTSQKNCLEAYKKLKSSFEDISKIKKQGEEYTNKILSFKSELRNIFVKKLTEFKANFGTITNNKFSNFLGKFGEKSFFNSMGININESVPANIIGSLSESGLRKIRNDNKFGIGGFGITMQNAVNSKTSICGRTSIRGELGIKAASVISANIATTYGNLSMREGVNGSIGINTSVKAFL